MESYSVWSFMTDCFHLAQCFRGLFHCSVCLCFILSYDQIIQFTDITAIYVPIHLWWSFGSFPLFCPLWLEPLWTLTYRFLHGQMFPVFPSISLEVALLRPAVTYICENCQTALQSDASTLFAPASCESSDLSTCSPTVVGFRVQPASWAWSDVSSLLWFASPWRQMMLSIFSCAYWPFAFSLGKNSVSVSVLQLGIYLFLVDF